MQKETEARLLHMIGALLYHHAEMSGVPVSELLSVSVLPALENESVESQIGMVQLIIRGERTALEVAASLKMQREADTAPNVVKLEKRRKTN